MKLSNSYIFVLSAIILALSSTVVFSQTPEKISYQAVIRDGSNNLVVNSSISMQISILQSGVNGNPVYVETQNENTNENGLLSIEIGNGNLVSGSFGAIDWSNGPYFIKTETDPTGGTNYTISGTSQLLSVPYALYAKTSGSSIPGPQGPQGIVGIDGATGSQGPAGVDGLSVVQTLSQSGNIITLSDDGGSVIITDNDTQLDAAGVESLGFASGTHTTDTDTHLDAAEIIALGFTSGDHTIDTNTQLDEAAVDNFVANNGYLTIEADGSTTNEIQDLTQVLAQNNNAGALRITNLADPMSAQDAATKAYVDLLISEIRELEGIVYGVTDIDGNFYPGVKIGTQIWMGKSLQVTRYPNGNAIPYITDNTTWGNLADDNTSDAYSYYANNDTNGDTYGALYTYAAAIGDNWLRDNSTNQGVCPDGWHLPSDVEWTTLTDYLGGLSLAGGKLRETGSTYWPSPNTGATNETGFSARPGGKRYYNVGSFGQLDNGVNFWSSTSYIFTNAWVLGLGPNSTLATHTHTRRSAGLYVRCVKD